MTDRFSIPADQVQHIGHQSFAPREVVRLFGIPPSLLKEVK